MPAMNTEAPAGYFSTFSIIDPSGTAEGQVRAQKRNRRVFVCIPCHKRKLRCDKGSPCARCVSSGSIADCIYQPFPSAAKPQRQAPSRSSSRDQTRTPPAITPADRCQATYRHSDGRAVVYGSTHWAKIANVVGCSVVSLSQHVADEVRVVGCPKFDEAVPYVFGTDPMWAPRYRQIKSLKYLFPAVTGANFPLGNLCSPVSKNLRVLDVLPPRHVVEALAANYFETFETTHRLLHPRQFGEELAVLWKSPAQLPEGWLAQLCMMLALGGLSAPEYVFQGTGRPASAWTGLLLDAAELALSRSPFMAAPNLMTVRTLCMMVIARLTEARPGNPEELACFMGFVSRLAASLQLHRSTQLFAGMPGFEAEMRRRVWTTVQLLDLDVALRSGTSYLCLDQDADPPLNVNETDFHHLPGSGWTVDNSRTPPAHEHTDGTFQIRAAELLPLLSEAINAVNSPTRPTVDYEKVLSWDAKMRQKLRDAETTLMLGAYAGVKRTSKAQLQYQFLEVVVHRTLLALHHTYAAVETTARYEQSRVAVLEGSLAILDVHHSWASPVSRCPSVVSDSSLMTTGSSPTVVAPELVVPPPGWLMDLCHDDFAAAIMYGLLAFRRHDFEEADEDEFCPSRLACTTIAQATTFLRDRACTSLPHFKEYLGVTIMCVCMRALQKGEPLLPRVLSVANDVEQLVITSKQDMVWAVPSSLDFSILDRMPDMASYIDLDLDATAFT